MIIASVGGVLAGFLYGAIPGALRAYRGAHEVITTIMLNFVAIQVGRYLVGIGGPLQKPNSGTPFSDKLPDVGCAGRSSGASSRRTRSTSGSSSR